MGLDYPNDLDECKYEYWMKLDLLTIVQISFIVCGNEPPYDNGDFFRHPAYYQDQHKVYNLLLNAMEANKIKTTSKDEVSAKAPPVDWLTCLMQKSYPLPSYLNNFILNHIPCEASTNQVVSSKRSKDSYLPKEGRDDEKALKAVLRTMLDLFPKLPKERLIELAPIRIYANGDAHSPEFLKKMISEIEGGNRPSGRTSINEIEEISKEIPKQWLKKK